MLRQVEGMENQGIIRKSWSEYVSPIIVPPGVKKYRINGDFRAQNSIKVDEKTPMPLIEACFDKIGRAIYFSSVDLAKGYYQILIKKRIEKRQQL